MTAPDPLLREITALLVQHCGPEEIVLFGSRAKGLARLDSDVDVLVLTAAEIPSLRRDAVRSLFLDFPVEVEVLFSTPGRFAADRADPHGFAWSVAQSGVTLYRRDWE